MALQRKATTAPVKEKQSRKLVLSETHRIEAALTRKDEKANLFEAVIDLGEAKVAYKQITVPTSVDSDGLQDVIDFFTELKNTLDSAPEPVVTEA